MEALQVAMEPTPKTYWLETYGCQMNFAESNSLELDLLHHGYLPAQFPEEASVVIINTCSVRTTAENRIRGRLGYFKSMKRSRKVTVVLTGCMAQRLIDQELQEQGVDVIIGTNGKQHVVSLLAGENSQDLVTYEFSRTHHKPGDLRAFVPIMNGCNNFCSYCIVPYVRGREISRSPQEIFDEISFLDDTGVKEITLLGQNVNSYAYRRGDASLGFTDLLDGIARRVSSVQWIRFLSSHPKDISPAIGELMLEHRSICRHIHIPIQHGSNSVLKRMNRKYTREHFLGILASLREQVPGITFSSDILIGFPGETEQDVELTLSAMREARFNDAFTYYFNPREGTEAAGYSGQLDDDTKLSRLKCIIAEQKAISLLEKQRRIGTIELVLVEDRAKKQHDEKLARTEHDDMVVIASSAALEIGAMVPVRLNSLSGNTLKGELASCGK